MRSDRLVRLAVLNGILLGITFPEYSPLRLLGLSEPVPEHSSPGTEEPGAGAATGIAPATGSASIPGKGVPLEPWEQPWEPCDERVPPQGTAARAAAAEGHVLSGLAGSGPVQARRCEARSSQE